jgi:hypothetical protein
MKLPGVLKIQSEDEDVEQQTSLLQSKKKEPKTTSNELGFAQ